ncbi:DUF2218 domain-containing protein [Labrys sp. KB_33_2]|uniref:DUF2218 domain-containing protein n=1 Tax=Labrys sp. KB_33_2 TaxID=3237479 RepID=UPI003F932E86
MSTLNSELRIDTSFGNEYLNSICNDFETDEFPIRRTGETAQIELPRGRGTAYLAARPSELTIKAEADTEQGLSALKFILSLRLEKAAQAEKPELVWTGDGCDITVLPGLREMRVRQVTQVTPLIRRITLAGEDLQRFTRDGIHIRLLIPPAGLDKPEWPRPARNGRRIWPPEERRPTQRLYTIRRIDAAAGEVDVDFVLHGDAGIASGWAARAKPGDIVGMLGPGGGEIDEADWYLIAGDETAIPAIARIFEAMPAEARGIALIEVADADEIQALVPPAGVELKWLLRDGCPAGESGLLAEAVIAVPLPSEGRFQCWLGAEAETARRLRHHWREVLQLPKHAVSAVAYWHRGEPGH